jgi:hypothetical protein
MRYKQYVKLTKIMIIVVLINLFGKQITINNKKWKQDLFILSLYYRTEIIFFVVGFIIGAIIF